MAAFSFWPMIKNAVLLAKMRVPDRNAKKILNEEKRLCADDYIVVEVRLIPPLKM